MDSVFYSRQRIIKNANVSFNPIALQPFFTNRVFQIFDKDNSGSISLQEFIDAIHQFAGQSPEDKIKFLFKVYDIDGKQIRINKSKHFDWFRDWNCDSMSNACSTRECSLLSIVRSFLFVKMNLFVCFNIGDGLIQHRELQHVMRACMVENGMQFSEDQVRDHSNVS